MLELLFPFMWLIFISFQVLTIRKNFLIPLKSSGRFYTPSHIFPKFALIAFFTLDCWISKLVHTWSHPHPRLKIHKSMLSHRRNVTCLHSLLNTLILVHISFILKKICYCDYECKFSMIFFMVKHMIKTFCLALNSISITQSLPNHTCTLLFPKEYSTLHCYFLGKVWKWLLNCTMITSQFHQCIPLEAEFCEYRNYYLINYLFSVAFLSTVLIQAFRKYVLVVE
jgi:hypothetical protein